MQVLRSRAVHQLRGKVNVPSIIYPKVQSKMINVYCTDVNVTPDINM